MVTTHRKFVDNFWFYDLKLRSFSRKTFLFNLSLDYTRELFVLTIFTNIVQTKVLTKEHMYTIFNIFNKSINHSIIIEVNLCKMYSF